MNANVTLRVNEVGSNGDFWDTMQRQRYDLPERYLLLAVLKDALLSYRKALRRRGKCRCVERAWFFDDDTDRLFSFESVCAALGLSPARIRGHLLLWERHTLAPGIATERMAAERDCRNASRPALAPSGK